MRAQPLEELGRRVGDDVGRRGRRVDVELVLAAVEVERRHRAELGEGGAALDVEGELLEHLGVFDFGAPRLLGEAAGVPPHPSSPARRKEDGDGVSDGCSATAAAVAILE